MPTYGYRCTACKHEFERFQKISDPAITECETCGAPVKKIMYPVGIAFKGTGFYVNDYSAKGGSPSSVGKSEGGDGAAASTEGDKPAAPDAPAATTDAPATTTTPAAASTENGKPAAPATTTTPPPASGS